MERDDDDDSGGGGGDDDDEGSVREIWSEREEWGGGRGCKRDIEEGMKREREIKKGTYTYTLASLPSLKMYV